MNDLPEESAQEIKQRVFQRLYDAGRWGSVISKKRDELYCAAKRSGMTKDEALIYAYSQIDQLFPAEKTSETSEMGQGDVTTPNGSSGSTNGAGSHAREEGSVTGLASIPADWPTLPPNASLAAEILWVQASRLDVVQELPSGAIRVDLSKADQPAPSKAAIGWLETSIRSFTKFCDIAAKATVSIEDGQEHVRRERMAIEEVRSLLAEMRPPVP